MLYAQSFPASQAGASPLEDCSQTLSRTLFTNRLWLLPVQVRDWIAPVNRRWPLRELVGSLHRHFPRGSTRGPHGRHVLIEYVMLRGVNDSLEDAHR